MNFIKKYLLRREFWTLSHYSKEYGFMFENIFYDYTIQFFGHWPDKSEFKEAINSFTN